MAFLSEGLKASAGGNGKAPTIFTYNTDDTDGEIESANYFRDGAMFLTLGDIIYVSYDIGTATYIVSHVAVVDGGAHEVNIQEASVFVGDTRASDVAGPGATETMSLAIQGANGLFNFYAYRNNSNTKAEMLVAGYFWGAGHIRVGDLITCIASDGYQILRVLTVGVASDATTTELVTLA